MQCETVVIPSCVSSSYDYIYTYVPWCWCMSHLCQTVTSSSIIDAGVVFLRHCHHLWFSVVTFNLVTKRCHVEIKEKTEYGMIDMITCCHDVGTLFSSEAGKQTGCQPWRTMMLFKSHQGQWLSTPWHWHYCLRLEAKRKITIYQLSEIYDFGMILNTKLGT